MTNKSSLNLQPVETTKASVAIYEQIKEKIVSGELKPGERLMEIHLADRLGVSRTPIREAAAA